MIIKVHTGYHLKITHIYTTLDGQNNETNRLTDVFPELFDQHRLHHTSELYLSSKSDSQKYDNKMINCQI